MASIMHERNVSCKRKKWTKNAHNTYAHVYTSALHTHFWIVMG